MHFDVKAFPHHPLLCFAYFIHFILFLAVFLFLFLHLFFLYINFSVSAIFLVFSICLFFFFFRFFYSIFFSFLLGILTQVVFQCNLLKHLTLVRSHSAPNIVFLVRTHAILTSLTTCSTQSIVLTCHCVMSLSFGIF